MTQLNLVFVVVFVVVVIVVIIVVLVVIVYPKNLPLKFGGNHGCNS